MYIYIDKTGTITTQIDHGEPVRQGNGLRLVICFDKDDTNINENSVLALRCKMVDIHSKWSGDTYYFTTSQNFEVFRKIKTSEMTYDLIDGERYRMFRYADGSALPVNEYTTANYGKLECLIELYKNGEALITDTAEINVSATYGKITPKHYITQTEYTNLLTEISKRVNADGGVANNLTLNGGTANNLALDGGTASNLALDGGTANNLALDGGTASNLALDGGTASNLALDGGTANNLTLDGGTANNLVLNGGTANNLALNGVTIGDFNVSQIKKFVLNEGQQISIEDVANYDYIEYNSNIYVYSHHSDAYKLYCCVKHTNTEFKVETLLVGHISRFPQLENHALSISNYYTKEEVDQIIKRYVGEKIIIDLPIGGRLIESGVERQFSDIFDTLSSALMPSFDIIINNNITKIIFNIAYLHTPLDMYNHIEFNLTAIDQKGSGTREGAYFMASMFLETIYMCCDINNNWSMLVDKHMVPVTTS